MESNVPLNIYEDAVSQYIDISGKTRGINYRYNGEDLSLITFPMPPLDLPENGSVAQANIETVLEFLKEKNLIITQQDGDIEKKEIRGLWVDSRSQIPGVTPRYIPLKRVQSLSSIPFSVLQPPISLNLRSDLKLFKTGRRVAEYLKQYVMYTYALNPKDFDREKIVVRPGHIYDLEKLNKRLYTEDEDGINDVMYDSGGRLIVTSEKVADKLMEFLKVSLLNDTAGVLDLAKGARTIDNYYNSIDDFKNVNGQLLFMERSDIQRWKDNASASNLRKYISSTLLDDIPDPYYFRNLKIKDNQIVLIQNVDGGALDKALMVSLRWLKDKLNLGYDPDITKEIEGVTYIIYSLDRPSKTKIYPGGSKIKAIEGTVPIVAYGEDEYAALLLLV